MTFEEQKQIILEAIDKSNNLLELLEKIIEISYETGFDDAVVKENFTTETELKK